ncbi:MAG TPA: ribose 5-phosphate isomerase A [Puia sp.]|nr:ribose 5-phosphate isomerase A [Puia sp.]
MQDFKLAAAAEVFKLIRPGTTIGLGAGTTIAHLIAFIKDDEELARTLKIASSSFATRQLLLRKGFTVLDMGWLSRTDQYFDGCDQFDRRLSALKSGGGIHTNEKILAAMADEFILAGDAAKRVDKLDGTYPLVVEVIPEALAYVSDRLKRFFNPQRSELRMSNKKEGAVLTEHGNFLIDNWFSPFPEPALLNERLVSIPGILEHSLFFNMAHKAVVAGPEGVEICGKAW